ncbi:transposase [Parafrankia sp. FMc6]|uniref:transposase n=1 Tax=Parafrankia soli TaxID=2599596 RepID=UPI0034D5CA85
MRALARLHADLTREITDLDQMIGPLVTAINPALLAVHGVGPDVTGQLLVTAGGKPDRLRSKASFAMLTGVAPLPASSGRTHRHQLNRGGDRQTNNALRRIVNTRMGTDARTRAYVTRRTKEGLSKPEIIRCLKRYVARENYSVLTPTPPEDLASAA